jgi:hypothetical protein
MKRKFNIFLLLLFICTLFIGCKKISIQEYDDKVIEFDKLFINISEDFYEEAQLKNLDIYRCWFRILSMSIRRNVRKGKAGDTFQLFCSGGFNDKFPPL